MRASEFLTEWLIKQRIGNIMMHVSDHLQDQARDRGIPWHYVERIMQHLHLMGEKLQSVQGVDQFYIRDDLTWTEIGSRMYVRDGVMYLYLNTVVRTEPGKRRRSPVITLD